MRRPGRHPLLLGIQPGRRARPARRGPRLRRIPAAHVSRHAYCWGNNGDGELATGDTSTQTSPVEIASDQGVPYAFDDIAVGPEGVCGKSGDDVYCWGAGLLGAAVPDSGAPLATHPVRVAFP